VSVPVTETEPHPAAASRFGFLGLRFDDVTLAEAVERVIQFVKSGKPHSVFTLNAELIVRAQTDAWLRDVYQSAHLATVDSYVVGYSIRACGHALREPVSAARLMFALLPVANAEKFSVYLLGASEDIVRTVARRITEQYPDVVIAGFRNGYFDSEAKDEVVEEIRASNADLLFVAMSTPLKEAFIHTNLATLNVPVCIGVGGTFDIIAGKTKHAPGWISRLGLEWFYRFAQEPRRLWKRYLTTNAVFLRLLGREWLRTTRRAARQ
jgi:N-acetylglucosaminyldiphosphoundecaprenol N-acetyl-beta-D-mannosaminyltransferase